MASPHLKCFQCPCTNVRTCIILARLLSRKQTENVGAALCTYVERLSVSSWHAAKAMLSPFWRNAKQPRVTHVVDAA